MGIDICSWRIRIGRFSFRIKDTCNIARCRYDVSQTCLSFVMLIMAAASIELLLVIGGIELNPGPPSNRITFEEDSLVHCEKCGLIWSINEVGLSAFHDDAALLSKFTCKTCLLEIQIHDLRETLHNIAIGISSKIDGLLEELCTRCYLQKPNLTPNQVIMPCVPISKVPTSHDINQLNVLSRSVVVLGDANSQLATDILSSCDTTFNYTFNSIINKGYNGLCKVTDNLLPGSKVIIQLSKYDINYFYRKPAEWLNSWSVLTSKLKQKQIHLMFTGLIPIKNGNKFWYDNATKMNKCMFDFCKMNNLHFCHIWPKFWGNNKLYANDIGNLNSVGAAKLAFLWLQDLQSLSPSFSSLINNSSQPCLLSTSTPSNLNPNANTFNLSSNIHSTLATTNSTSTNPSNSATSSLTSAVNSTIITNNSLSTTMQNTNF
jgi:hypothetical protein